MAHNIAYNQLSYAMYTKEPFINYRSNLPYKVWLKRTIYNRRKALLLLARLLKVGLKIGLFCGLYELNFIYRSL